MNDQTETERQQLTVTMRRAVHNTLIDIADKARKDGMPTEDVMTAVLSAITAELVYTAEAFKVDSDMAVEALRQGFAAHKVMNTLMEVMKKGAH